MIGHQKGLEPPNALSVCVDNIPPALTARDHWVAWQWEWSAKREEWTKVPLNTRTGGRASSTNPSTWSGFGDALAFADVRGLAGVGFIVTFHDPLTGLDKSDISTDREVPR
jgi:primase-polymerase (primpol)-like protein